MKKEIKKLDNLFREYVRRRAMQREGGCERCLTAKYDAQKEDGSIFPAWKHLQCAHMFTRKGYSVRWDEDDAVGLCGGCHMYIDAHPVEKIEFFKGILGEERFLMLQIRATRNGKVDKEAITLYLKEKIKELHGGK